jgi:hypothetical protein
VAESGTRHPVTKHPAGRSSLRRKCGRGRNRRQSVRNSRVRILSFIIPSLPSLAYLIYVNFYPTRWRSPEPISERSDLRNTIHVEPISLKLTASGAPDLYGTRLSTVLLIRRDGHVLFIERDVHTVGNDQVTSSKRDTPSERVFRFTLDTNQIHGSQGYA